MGDVKFVKNFSFRPMRTFWSCFENIGYAISVGITLNYDGYDGRGGHKTKTLQRTVKLKSEKFLS